MASIRERKQAGKASSFYFTCCLGRDAKGRQIRRYIVWTPPEGLTPSKAKKAAEKAAEAWEQKQVSEYQKDLNSPERVSIRELTQKKMGFSEFVRDVWFPLQVDNGEHKAKTVSFYHDTVKNITEYFGDRLMQSIDSIAVQRFLIYLRTEKQYSVRYVHHHYRTLNMIFTFAVKQGILDCSPMEEVDKPKLSKQSVDAFSTEEATQFFDALHNEPLEFRCMLFLMMTTGIRRGECVGLKWRDIDEAGAVLRIERNVVYPGQCEEPLCKQIIVMTGTPEPLDEIDLGQGWAVIDKRSSCRNVQPENVHFLTAQNAYKQISKQLENNEKIIYFTNRTKTADEFAQDSGIDKNYISVSFSNEEKRNAMATGDKKAFNQMECIEQYLQKNCKLPDDTHLFVTTSRYKEGVNIENTDINCMYIESHLPCDVVQMAARVRSGVKDLYIIVDSACHPSKLSTQDAYEDEAIVREGALYSVYKNTFYPKYNLAPLCRQHGDAQHAVCQNQYSPIAAKIAHTEARYPFIRYSYFDNDFHFYEARRASMHYLYKWEHIFKRAFHNNTVHKLVQRWFPDANIEPYETPKMQARNYIRKLINENSKPEEGKHIYSKSEVNTVLSALNEIFKTNLKSENALLKKFSCLRFKQVSHHKNSPDYENYRLINSNTQEVV